MASSRTLCVVAALLLATGLVAQVPPGWIVVGTTTQGSAPVPPWGNQPGLYLAHPRLPGAMIAVTGLPPSLTTPPPGWVYEYGVGGVAIHPPTGDLLVGNVPAAGQNHELLRIRITPAATTPPTYAATVLQTIVLGPTSPGWGGLVSQIAVRDASRVIVACSNSAGGPIGAGAMVVGEVDLSSTPPGITPWPAVNACFAGAGHGRAACVDDAGQHAYFAGSPGTGFTDVLKVPLPAAGAPTGALQLSTALPLLGFTLRWDRAAQKLLLSGRLNPANGQALWQVDPGNGAAVPVGPDGPTSIATFDIEPTTGQLLFMGNQMGVAGLHLFTRGTVAGTWLANSTATATVGLPFACAVAPSPTPFGVASVVGAAPTVSWAATSNAGLPLVGNQGYSLQLDVGATGTLAFGVLFASGGKIGPTSIPGLGLVLHIAPPVISGPTFTTPTIPLPIPNLAALAGQDLFLQALTVTTFPGPGAVLGATEGAWLRIL